MLSITQPMIMDTRIPKESISILRNFSLSMVPCPSSSRMCRWAMAAPAFQQAYTSSAISSGVMGTLGLLALVGQAPVVATVMIVLFFRSAILMHPLVNDRWKIPRKAAG